MNSKVVIYRIKNEDDDFLDADREFEKKYDRNEEKKR